MKRLARNNDGLIIRLNDGRTQHIAFEYNNGDKKWWISNKAVWCACITVVLLADTMISAIAGHGLITPALANTVDEFWKLRGFVN